MEIRRDHLQTHQGFSGFGSSDNRSDLVSTDRPGQSARRVSTTSPTSHRHILGVATYIRNKIEGISASTMRSYDYIFVRAKTEYELPAPLKVILVDMDGNSFSAPVQVTDSWQDHRIPLHSFEPDRFMLLPRAYPSIMESWYATGAPGPVRPAKLEEIQFYIDTYEAADFNGERYGFEIDSAWLDSAR